MKQLLKIKKEIFSSKKAFAFFDNFSMYDKNGNIVNGFNKVTVEEKYYDYSIIEKDKEVIYSFVYSLLNKDIQEELKVLTDYKLKESFFMDFFKKTSEIFLCLFYFYKESQKIIAYKNEAIKYQIQNTDVSKIEFKNFNIPLDFFYLSIEDNIGKYYIDGVFVENLVDALELTILFMGEDSLCKYIKVDLFKKGFVTDSIEKSLKILNSQNETIFDNGDLEKKLEEEYKDKIIVNHVVKIVVNTMIFFDTFHRTNNLLYFVEEKDETISIKNLKTEKGIKKKSKKYSESNYYFYLGSNSNKNKDINDSIKKGKKIEKQFLVTGHYRKQPVGERDSSKFKVIWIEPYLKGRNYKMDNKIHTTVI